MDLLKILLISFGAFCIAAATECIPETAKCSKYWEKVLPHKDLMATESELDSWCSKQTLFYQCLEDVLLDGKNGNLSYLPTNLLISKLFAQDLCSDGSKSRKRLLDNAECINELNTDFCILPEYLEIVTPDDVIPSTRCSQAEKTFSCIAATMVLNCGFDAARVYRTMLKITHYSDDICGIETSGGIPPCEVRSESANRDKKLSEIYYGLFHRIGDLFDQDNEIEDSISEEDSTRQVAETVSEVIQNAIDDLDKNLVSEECSTPACLDSAPDTDSIPCSKDIDESKPYMKNPSITEIFKEFLFYNYSGIEYAVYWRQPLYSSIENMHCEQLHPSYAKVQVFRCRMDNRYKDPDCLSNATVHEKVTPDFIRSFDPEVPCDSTVEFGPRPEFMKELDKMYEEKRIWEQKESGKSSVVTKVPEASISSTLLKIATTVSPLEIPRDWYKSDYRNKLNWQHTNMPVPNELFFEIMDLLKPGIETYHPEFVKIQAGDSTYVMYFNEESMNRLEKITCGRLDECHPRGRGLWKCKAWPRKITTCDNCEKVPEIDERNFSIIYASLKPRGTTDTKLETTTEPAATTLMSDVLESSTLGESIALVFSGDMESGKRSETVDSQNELDSDLDSFNDQTNFKEQVDFKNVELDEDAGIKYLVHGSETGDEVGLQILNSILNAEEDFESSEMAYAVDNDDESEVIIATEDGLIAGNILLVKRISDFEDQYSR